MGVYEEAGTAPHPVPLLYGEETPDRKFRLPAAPKLPSFQMTCALEEFWLLDERA